MTPISACLAAVSSLDCIILRMSRNAEMMFARFMRPKVFEVFIALSFVDLEFDVLKEQVR